MKILVIGGTYFLGKAFVDLASAEHEITVLNRGNRKNTFDKSQKVKEIIIDRHALEEKHVEGEDFDIVVDFCGYVPEDIRRVARVLKGKISQYIFISTSDVYKRGTGAPVTEQSALEDKVYEGKAGEYIRGKVALEKELPECAGQYHFSYTSIRPVFIYGPGNYAPRENIFFNWIDKAGQIIYPEDATGFFQMVYVGDVARAILQACGNAEAYDQSFNLCGPELVTYETFAESLRYATKCDFAKVMLSAEEINQKEIPLPFPLTKEESEVYESSKSALLLEDYTELHTGLSHAYENYQEREMLNHIDQLFDENKPKEAESYMLGALAEAEKREKKKTCLTLLNELIGYYRQTSEKEQLLGIIQRTLELLKELGEQKDLSYATSLLNIANAYRSIGELQNAEKYYAVTEAIYNQAIEEGILDRRDLLVAGLYNNISLMYQEISDYKKAEDYLLKALDIVTYRKAGFEIAVTYANLANTLLLAKDYEQAYRYAKKAIGLFKARGLKDPHYCAALSALAGCYFEWGNIVRAEKIYTEAASLVELSFGRNGQYKRLMESIEMCKKSQKEKYIPGMELSRQYYEEYGAPMIKAKFPAYEKQIAVGLAGEGSDCYGYDDDLSADHDYGPGFCLWVDEETYSKIGADLEKAYDELPDTYRGIQRNTTAMGQGRRGVMTISGFYARHLGTAEYDQIDFRAVPDYELAAVVNGEVFRDDTGVFTEIRNRIKQGYPADIRLLKLAEDVAGFSQCGQYNYGRMREREDELTASVMLSDFCRHAMKLYHHFRNVYPPHDKWLAKSTASLPGGAQIVEYMEMISCKAVAGESVESVTAVMDQLGELFARSLYETGDISDIDNYLDHHVEELIFKAGIALCEDKELVNRIAKLEFEAFDKVKNEGGRAYCQNDWPTFSIMRKSQYLTWNREMLMQYYYDFTREYQKGHNLITEKYGRMMESTSPERYEEIKDNFPQLSEEKKSVIEKIVAIQMNMVEEFARVHPKVAMNARLLHTYEDTIADTSYETYLRGEISTYSDKMLQLYGRFVVEAVQNGQNIALMTIENTAKLYGYPDIEAFEKNTFEE